MGGFGGGNIAKVSKDASTAIPFKLSDGGKTMVALKEGKSAQTLYVVLRGLELNNHMDVTITSYGVAAPGQEGEQAQRSYTFPHETPDEAAEYVLGQLKDKTGTIPENLFRLGACAP